MGRNYAVSPVMMLGSLPRHKLARGSTSSVVGVEQGPPVPNAHSAPPITGTSCNNEHIKRGKTPGVQCLSGYAGSFFGAEHQPVFTEEPSSIVDTPFNALQARARGQPAPVVTETLKAHVGGKFEMEGNKVGHGVAVKEPDKEVQVLQTRIHSKTPLADPYIERFSRRPLPWRVGTDPAPVSLTPGHTFVRPPVRPHPLRTTTIQHPTETTLHSTFNSPLQASLYTGSRTTPTLFMLVVAVAYGGLEDPQHDFELIQSWLKNHESRRVHFQGLSGEEATRERIEEAIGELYRGALQSRGSKLFILLTGEGDLTNRMHLMGERFITDSDIRIWLWKLRNEGKPIYVPTTIVLDYCRTNKHIPLGARQAGIEFIWSCSLGQRAAALKFKNPEGIPRSCFLLALIMASYNFRHGKNDLNPIIKRRLSQLLRFLELVKQLKGASHEEPQEADWRQAGNMEPIRDLISMLSETNVVPKVYRVFMNNKWFREANELPINWVLRNKRDPSGDSNRVRYKRGTCKPVCWARPLLHA